VSYDEVLMASNGAARFYVWVGRFFLAWCPVQSAKKIVPSSPVLLRARIAWSAARFPQARWAPFRALNFKQDCLPYSTVFGAALEDVLCCLVVETTEAEGWGDQRQSGCYVVGESFVTRAESEQDLFFLFGAGGSRLFPF
jgi:hypothetical protein